MGITPSEATEAVQCVQRIFGRSLVAVYLYFSAVVGGLRNNSDIDVFVVTAKPITREQHDALAAGLLESSGRYPPAPGARRPIELTVFTLDQLSNFRLPLRSEFVYGEWLRTDFEAGLPPLLEANADWTLVVAQVRQHGQALVGPAPNSLLPLVSTADIASAIRAALTPLLHDLWGDERNVMLTLARMWFTLATGKFTSKDAAAQWAARRAPSDVARTLELAQNGYLGSLQDSWETRSAEVERATEYLSRQIAQATAGDDTTLQ